MKTIGIIGGLGPETTAKFYLDLVFSCQKIFPFQKPAIIISNVPLPYQIEKDLIIKNTGSEKYLPFLITEAKRLEKAGADFIVMPCNSLHIFINEIRKAVSIPVLSIIEETIKFFKAKNFKRIGIISTSTTIHNKLYETAFQKEKIKYLIPNKIQQTEIGKIILRLVLGEQNKADKKKLLDIIDSFQRKKVDCVALACTDLQLLIPKHPRLKIFDTMKILADSSVAAILKNLKL